MVKDSFSSLVSNWIPATILFLLFLLALGAFIRRADIPALAKGLGRVVTLVLFSPLLFLRKLISEVADAERREEKESLSSDQFLIRRQFATAKAGLIISSVALLASGFAASWGMLPARKDFRNLREAREGLKVKEDGLRQMALRPGELDEQWAAKRASTLPKWFNQREEQLFARYQQILMMETELPEALIALLPAPPDGISLEDFGAREQRARQAFENSEALSSDPMAVSYFFQLSQLLRQAQDLAGRERSYRAQSQPEWSQVSEALDGAREAVAQASQKIVRFEEQIKTRRKSAISAFLGTLVAFYVLAWLSGLFIEVFSLAVRVAGDIRALRERQPGLLPAESVGRVEARDLSYYS